ncbi:MAG: iron donor protein CyaY [Alphaproteobacteria bacterium]|nr:iron donor protein CyaY [Alphaproteobacteria bacterium]
MDERAFETKAAATLARLAERLEAELADDLDVELRGGILTLELADGRQFIVNKHAPNRELWLSSPVSGAHHFAWRAEAWRSTRGDATLTGCLADDLDAALGRGLGLRLE